MTTKRKARKPSRSKEIVTTNISALEVISRGATIIIESKTPIDDRAIASGLRFDNTRVKPAISKQGRRVVVTVDALFAPGRNTLYLSDLFTPEHQPIVVDLEIPFFVVDSQVKFQRDVKVMSYSRVVVASDSIRRASPGERPSYELMRGFGRSNDMPWEAAYNQVGKKVDFDRVRADVLKAHIDRYGKLEPRLHELLSGAGGEPISVAIWLEGAAPIIEKNNRRETRRIPAAEAAERRRLFDLANRFTEQYKIAESGKNVRVDTAAPVVFAELDRRTIQRLADAPEVARIFIYDRKGVDDLGNSMAIAQADKAHDLGYTGSRVKVAVYERGPDVTTHLNITARYTSDPEKSWHSRLTHGIIKNNQENQPNGHAPDCLLHSANDRDLDAIRWAADEGCTVISQSFHRDAEETSPGLSLDDIYKDWLVLRWPYPTICEAAGNIDDGDETEFVNHKGYNRLTVGSHNDTAIGMANDTVYNNPHSDHGDRELPEIAAKGMGVVAVEKTASGTSFAAPAVAGAAACIQEANTLLKSWPEGCRAILLASASLNVHFGTWWDTLSNGLDAVDGTGALNTLNAVRIAEQHKGRDTRAAARGWDVDTLRSGDIGITNETTFSYNIFVPRRPGLSQATVKVALAWDSDITFRRAHHNTRIYSSVLTLNLDLAVYDSAGILTGYSGSWDNSYEIAEFRARHGETYTIKIRRSSGTDDVRYGIAWNTITTSVIPDIGEIGGVKASRRRK